MAVNDEVITAAHNFALHSQGCHVCGDPHTIELCPTGLELLKMFHDCLNTMLVQRGPPSTDT